ncbi:MAG: hypothetical protein BWK80_42880 [Desulfobacteraceae bacterium IS3]|nr:MAG: hypothetical protein BWK80_42880 [Desulfobacteraceae bacterium IS3]
MEFPHRKNEPQSYAKFTQSYAEFQNIYLCVTLRFTLRNFAVKKKQSCFKNGHSFRFGSAQFI